MTVFHCDGFEAYGDTTSVGTDIEALIDATNKTSFAEINGGIGGTVSLIDDFEGVGYALEFPDCDSARGDMIAYEFPDGTGRYNDYKVPTNASVPIFCVGFRFFNAAILPAASITATLFQALTGATSTSFSLRLNSDGQTLELVDADSTVHSATQTMDQDTWYYIEVEWKQTTPANGGYGKVYLNGNLVIDTGTVDMSVFTFFSTYGYRIGVSTSGSNQSGGSNFAIDDTYAMEIDGVEHTAPLGACRVLAMRPSADAVPNDWTPSTGADNYALVDDTDVDETDYVDATATGNDDHYDLTPLEGVSVVHGVRFDVACVAVDGTPTLHIGCDNGTADEDSMGIIGTGTTVNRQEFHDKDPDAADWTESSVESVEATMRMTE